MNLNLERVREMIEELERHREVIDDALKSLTSLEKVFNGTTAEKSARPVRAESLNPPANGEAKESSAGFACVKHPHSREFSARGQCKLCQSEHMKEYWNRKKKTRSATASSPSPVPPAESEETDDTSNLVFSKQQRCPKCGLTTRFRRDRDARPTDHWICIGAGCELKVANYRIAVDRDYDPADDALMQIS